MDLQDGPLCRRAAYFSLSLERTPPCFTGYNKYLCGNRPGNESEGVGCLGTRRGEPPKEEVVTRSEPNGVLPKDLKASLQQILPWPVDGRAMENVALHPRIAV